jgi:hypothetical protein
MPCGSRCGGGTKKQEKAPAKKAMAKKTPAKKSAAKKDAELLSTGKIAEELGATPAKVKKAIGELGLKPASTKGVCSYYTRAALAKIKAALA